MRHSFVMEIHMLALLTYNLASRRNIDDRIYFFTIHNRYSIRDMKYYDKIFIRVSREFDLRKANKTYPMTMVLCNDVEGTRHAQAEFKKSLYPHIHGLIILPRSCEKKYSLTQIIDKIKRALLGMHCMSAPPYVEKFDGRTALTDQIGYCTKASAQSSLQNLTGYDPIFLPLDRDLRCLDEDGRKEIGVRIQKHTVTTATDELWEHIHVSSRPKLWKGFGLSRLDEIDCPYERFGKAKAHVERLLGDELARLQPAELQTFNR